MAYCYETTKTQYEVLNLDTDESHGVYDTLGEARGCVRFDRLQSYSIWSGHYEVAAGEREFITIHRVECCEPYEGDDERVAQGAGDWIDRSDSPSLPGVPRP